LFIENWPDISDPEVYDYSVTTKTAIVPRIRRDHSSIRNRIYVKHDDENGRMQRLSPDISSSLSDADSIAAYGKRVKT
jgi:hypothetical protein